jgi:hypothetical protein
MKNLGCFLVSFFILSALYGTLYFAMDYLKRKGPISELTSTRYDTLEKYFPGSPHILEYISDNKNRGRMYNKLIWHLIDGLPYYSLEPRPNTSTLSF